MNAITPVFLQKPVKIGGYGFDTFQNACFMFEHLPFQNKADEVRY